jgi:hypothetical protein
LEVFKHRCNSFEAIREALGAGYGIEVDVRSFNSFLYLAHEPIMFEANMVPLEAIKQMAPPERVILNIKETGLIPFLSYSLGEEYAQQCFISDLLYPDLVFAYERGFKRTCARMSRFEGAYGEDIGVPNFEHYWLDYCFTKGHLNPYFSGLLNRSILVSPELHKQPLTDEYISFAKSLKLTGVCTDEPERWI